MLLICISSSYNLTQTFFLYLIVSHSHFFNRTSLTIVQKDLELKNILPLASPLLRYRCALPPPPLSFLSSFFLLPSFLSFFLAFLISPFPPLPFFMKVVVVSCQTPTPSFPKRKKTSVRVERHPLPCHWIFIENNTFNNNTAFVIGPQILFKFH